MKNNLVLNPYVNVKRIGIKKVFIKVGIINEKSFVLEGNELTEEDIELFNKLIAGKAFSVENLKKYSEKLIEFLIEESILVNEHSLSIENYYYAINNNNFNKNSIKNKKIGFIIEDEKTKKLVDLLVDDISVKHTFLSMEDLSKIREEEYDIIICLSNYYDSLKFHEINNYLIKTNIPFMINFIDGGNSFISPIFIKNNTVCYNEMEIQLEASLFYKTEYLAYKESFDNKKNNLLFLTSQIIFYALHLSIDFFITNKLKTKNRVLIFNLESLRYDIVDILPLPYCLGCKRNSKMTHDFL